MDYTTLVANKATDGSIKNWVNNDSFSAPTILAEAEDLDNIFKSTMIDETKEGPPYNFRPNPKKTNRYSPEDFRNKKIRKPKISLKNQNK